MKIMKLSDQSLGALMLALQKSIMEESDIVPVLKGFDFVLKDGELVVQNPPLVHQDNSMDDLDVAEQLELFENN